MVTGNNCPAAPALPPTFPASGNPYLQGKWPTELRSRAHTIYFPPPALRRNGRCLMYLCQAAPAGLIIRPCICSSGWASSSRLPVMVVFIFEPQIVAKKTYSARCACSAVASFSDYLVRGLNVPVLALRCEAWHRSGALRSIIDAYAPHALISDHLHDAVRVSFPSGLAQLVFLPIIQVECNTVTRPRLVDLESTAQLKRFAPQV